jgi:hypothetical protein
MEKDINPMDVGTTDWTPKLRNLCKKVRESSTLHNGFRIFKDHQARETTMGYYKPYYRIIGIKTPEWHVIVHEIFHYLHHMYVGESFYVTDNAVVEYIAEYATYLWGLLHFPHIGYSTPYTEYIDSIVADTSLYQDQILPVLQHFQQEGYLSVIPDTPESFLHCIRYNIYTDPVYRKADKGFHITNKHLDMYFRLLEDWTDTPKELSKKLRLMYTTNKEIRV